MFANGFTAEILLELIRAQLVSANPERTITDSKTIEVTRLRITDAGRRVFEGANPKASLQRPWPDEGLSVGATLHANDEA
jgi:hypothetical protein